MAVPDQTIDARPPPGRALARLVGLLAAGGLVVLGAGLWSITAAGAQAPDPPAEEPDTSIRGTLRANIDGEREPVEGVEIVVEIDGDEIDRITTDDQGEWEVELPGAGTYDVTVVTDTLPETAGLQDGQEATVEVEVREGQNRGQNFRLGEGRRSGTPFGERAFNLFVEGVKLGAIIAITSIGLSLIFGVTGLINFAHGELVTFGALMAWFLSTSSAGPGLHLIPAALLAILAGAALGGTLEGLLFRPLRARKTGIVALIVITIGLAMVLRYTYLILFGASAVPFRDYAIQRAVDIGPISLPPKDFVIIGISAVVLLAVALLLQKTKIGTGMRAVADNRDLAEASGIDVRRIIMVVWVAGASLASLGGVFLALTERVEWDMGFDLLLLMFAAVILGGLGSAYGAMVGGLIIGIAIQMSTLFVSTEFKLVVAYVLMSTVLLFRPQGLLGRAERVG